MAVNINPVHRCQDLIRGVPGETFLVLGYTRGSLPGLGFFLTGTPQARTVPGAEVFARGGVRAAQSPTLNQDSAKASP